MKDQVWYTSAIPFRVFSNFVKTRKDIPGPTRIGDYGINLPGAQREYSLAITDLIPPDETPTGGKVYRSREPHVMVRYVDIKKTGKSDFDEVGFVRGPYYTPVFKSLEDAIFVRIQIGGKPVDVYLIEVPTVLHFPTYRPVGPVNVKVEKIPVT
jgi:hypothetical protein